LDHDELSKLYASSDVFVFTSTSETYGNVVIEAMASGLPCVIANGGGSASLVDHGRTGYKCVPNNALEYVYFIHKILSDANIREDFREAGLAYVRKLDWAKLAETYFDDIQELAASPINSLAWASN
jgi:glycosyltransferase involved in cell wall biosynthesis